MKLMKRAFFCIGGLTLISAVSIGRSEASVTLTPSLSVSEEYSDNFFFSETDPVGEFTTVISPGIALVSDSKNVTFGVRYQGRAELRVRNPDRNRYNQGLSFDLDFPFLSFLIKGMKVKVTEAVTYVPELPAFTFNNQIQENNEGIQVPRTDTFRNRAGVAVTYPWTPRFGTTISYTNLYTRYKGSALQSSTVHDAELDLAYQFSRQTTGSVSVGGAVVNYADVQEDVVSYRFTIGSQHQIGPTFSFNGRLGVTTVRDDSTRLTLEAGLLKNVQAGSLSLQYTQGIGTGGGLTTTATLSQRLLGAVTLGIARNVSTFVQLAYGKNTSLSGKELDTTSYEAATGLSAVLRSWLSGGLRYAYLNQRARGVIGNDGERNVVTLTLTASALPWKIVK